MKEQTREWLEKAEEDYLAALSMMELSKPKLYAPICFHAQQCVEKYLKALLVEHNIYFAKTHDLTALLNILLTTLPEWELHRDPLRTLNRYAVEYRYPGEESIIRATAQDAINILEEARTLIRSELSL